MKPKLFLTSSVSNVASDISSKLDLSANNKLVFIETASEQEALRGENMQWQEEDKKALLNVGFEIDSYTITGKNKKQLLSDLKDYDYIYMSGGDTTYLLEQSVKSEFIDLVRDFVLTKGKTYIGTSAGSIIAGPHLNDYHIESAQNTSLQSFEAYCLVNFLVIPHWDSKDFEEFYFPKKIVQTYKEDQVPLILLTDSQYILVEGENMQIYDVTNQ